MSETTAILGRIFGPRPLRSWRLWLLVLLVVYTLAGFFLAPYLIRQQLIETITQDLNREASVGEVRANPFLLSLEVNDLAGH